MTTRPGSAAKNPAILRGSGLKTGVAGTICKPSEAEMPVPASLPPAVRTGPNMPVL